MHPLIARYLNAPALIEVLEKADQAVALSPDEAAMAASATAHPDSKSAVLKSKGRATLSNDAQQHMLRIIVDAALRRVSADHELGPKVRAATAALTKEGASEEEAHHLLLQAVLDEAFGWAEDPTSFDARFLGETLDGLVALAAVTSDSVDDCMEAFAKAGGENRALRYTVAEALMEAAWGEGPEPVTPEHVDLCLESLSSTVSRGEFVKAVETVAAFLDELKTRGWVGPKRHERLMQVLRSAVASGELDPDLEEEEDGDDEPAA